MVEDLRDHKPYPTEEEREWIEFDPCAGMVNLAAIMALSVALGVSVSLLVDEGPLMSPLVVAHE